MSFRDKLKKNSDDDDISKYFAPKKQKNKKLLKFKGELLDDFNKELSYQKIPKKRINLIEWLI